ncbi:BamA/TamA family outer membrane protein [bacterium]|nr:BamA/TamA family outer membrane protein [candidate division CSSED10-310 bacterium]
MLRVNTPAPSFPPPSLIVSMRVVSRLIVCLIALLIIAPVHSEPSHQAAAQDAAQNAAQDPPYEDSQKDVQSETQDTSLDRSTEPDWGIAPIIVPFYSPETGFGGAISGIVYWNARRSAARPDQASLTAVYTEKEQFFAGINSDKYVWGDRFLAELNIGFSDWKETFFGIGGEPPPGYADDYEEEYSSSGFRIGAGWAVKMAEGLYLGIEWNHDDVDPEQYESGAWLETSGLTGCDGGAVSGPGLSLTWDTRDEAFYPTRGFLVETVYHWFDAKMGSDFDYDAFKTDLRIYHSFRPRHIVAANIEFETTDGDVPFYQLPSLSTRSSMRGIEEGTYIDANRWAVQAEYRFPVFRRFGGVVFAACGNVAPHVADLADDAHFAGGAGIRYTVEKNKNINIRLDIGFDEDGETSVYFTLREAF